MVRRVQRKDKKEAGWCNGLKKVGDVYHYRFMFRGVVYTGSTGTGDLKLARVIAQRRRDEVVAAANGIRPVPTLRALYEEWKERHRNSHLEKSLNRLEGHHRDLARLWDQKVDTLTTPVVDEILNRYLDRQKKRMGVELPTPAMKSGANEVLKALKTVMNFAVAEGCLQKLPFRNKKFKVPRVPRPYLTRDQLLPFLEALDRIGRPQHRIMVRLMLLIGLREKEARMARWEWLDAETNQYTPFESKTDNPRPVRVPKPLMAWLLQLRPDSGTGLMAGDPNGRPFGQGITSKVIRQAGASLGVPNLTPHAMRRTLATVQLHEGVDIKSVQANMRHDDIHSTFFYLQASPPLAQQAMEAYGRMFSEAPAEAPGFLPKDEEPE